MGDIFVHDRGTPPQISGKVTNSNGDPLSGITIRANFPKYTKTDANGYYSFSSLASGSYDIYPVHPCYTFSPESVSLTFPPEDQVQNFVGTLDLGAEISHVEYTQVTQDEANEVPLITGKPTLIRVYVYSQSNCSVRHEVSGQIAVSGVAGSLVLQPSPKNVIAYNPETWQEQRGDLKKTLNFILPTHLAREEVTFEISLSSGASLTEVQEFQSANPLHIAYVPIDYTWMGVAVCKPDSQRISKAAELAKQVYPTAFIDYYRASEAMRVPRPNVLCNPVDSSTKEGGDLVISWLEELTRLSTRIWPQPDFVFGWLPSGYTSAGCGGVSDPTWAKEQGLPGNGKAAFGFDCNPEVFSQSGARRGVQRIFTHETGHLLNRHHTNTTANVGDLNCEQSILGIDDESDWVQENFPDAKIQDYGTNLITGNLIDPSSNYDYMSYCHNVEHTNVWTSPWTYEKIFSEELQTQNKPSEPALPEDLQSYFMVSGAIVPGTPPSATLDPIWRVDSSGTALLPPAGTEYCLQAQNDFGTPLSSHCFDAQVTNYESITNTGSSPFLLMIPYSGDIKRVVLVQGAQVITSREFSPNPPNIQVVSPTAEDTWLAGQEYIVRWDASDDDQDDLLFDLLYSPDNQHWIPLGVGISENEYSVDASKVAGGGSAFIRVLATDGANNSTADSGLFTVERKPPEVIISAPEDGSFIEMGAPLFLNGYANDLEDGMLADTSLVWSSDRDGVLGSGSLFLAELSPGAHVLTLTAEDGDGSYGSASIELFVGERVYLPALLR